MKIIYEKKNKYIRLRIAKVGCNYRADISVNKYFYYEEREKYYELNYGLFSHYDYSSEEEAFEKAKEWLYDELKLLQENINLGGNKDEK